MSNWKVWVLIYVIYGNSNRSTKKRLWFLFLSFFLSFFLINNWSNEFVIGLFSSQDSKIASDVSRWLTLSSLKSKNSWQIWINALWFEIETPTRSCVSEALNSKFQDACLFSFLLTFKKKINPISYLQGKYVKRAASKSLWLRTDTGNPQQSGSSLLEKILFLFLGNRFEEAELS